MDNRKLIYALLSAALLVNFGYSFWNGAFPIVKDDSGPGWGGDPAAGAVFEIADPRVGDQMTTEYEMNLTLEKGGPDPKSERGHYVVSGEMVRSRGDRWMERNLTGDFRLTYISQKVTVLSLQGWLNRKSTLELDPKGVITTLVSHTRLVMDGGPYGSDSETDVKRYNPAGSWGDVLWSVILAGGPILDPLSSGTESVDLSIEEIGLTLENVSLEWYVNSIMEERGIKTAEVNVRLSTDLEIGFGYTMTLEEGKPWPIRYEMWAEGIYPSEEGTVRVSLSLSEEAVMTSRGHGYEVGIPKTESKSGIPAFNGVLPMNNVPIEGGGGSSFRFTPREALDFALCESTGLSDFMKSSGGAGAVSMSYYRNDTRVGPDTQIWNVTLSPAETGVSGYFFSVGSPVIGSILERTAMTLLDDDTIPIGSHPHPGRGVLTLNAHEETLYGLGSWGESFFQGNGYAPSYSLEFRHRRGGGSPAECALINNMLGLHRHNFRDLFISQVQDRLDPSTIQIAVVDGNSGAVLSTTSISGGCTLLLSSLDLA